MSADAGSAFGEPLNRIAADGSDIASMPTEPSKPKSHWGMPELLAGIALTLLPVGWLAFEFLGFRRFHKTVEDLKDRGASLGFKFDLDHSFLHYYFSAPATADMSGKKLNTADFNLLRKLPNLVSLRIDDAEVPDEFISLLMSLNQLQKVSIQGTELTPAQLDEAIALLTNRKPEKKKHALAKRSEYSIG